MLFLPMKKVYFWQLFQCNVYKKLVLNLHFFTAFLLQKIENFSIVIFTFFSLLKKQVKVVNLALISCKDYNKKLGKMAIFCCKYHTFFFVKITLFWCNLSKLQWKSVIFTLKKCNIYNEKSVIFTTKKLPFLQFWLR